MYQPNSACWWIYIWILDWGTFINAPFFGFFELLPSLILIKKLKIIWIKHEFNSLAQIILIKWNSVGCPCWSKFSTQFVVNQIKCLASSSVQKNKCRRISLASYTNKNCVLVRVLETTKLCYMSRIKIKFAWCVNVLVLDRFAPRWLKRKYVPWS